MPPSCLGFIPVSHASPKTAVVLCFVGLCPSLQRHLSLFSCCIMPSTTSVKSVVCDFCCCMLVTTEEFARHPSPDANAGIIFARSSGKRRARARAHRALERVRLRVNFMP